MKKILLALTLTLTMLSNAQEKVKGNREPSTVITTVDTYKSIEIDGDYEVSLVEGPAAQVEITTDSNLHQYLKVGLENGRLSIKTTAKIRSKKELSIRLVYTKGLEKIIASEKAEIAVVTPLIFESISIEAKDNAKLFLTAEVGELSLDLKGSSKAEMNLKGENAIINMSDKASLKALINYTQVESALTDRSEAKIEGDIGTGTLTMENSSQYHGSNLVYNELDLSISTKSTAQVNVKEQLNLSASDDTEVEVYNSPQISLEKFTGKTQLIKK